jgi:ribonucleoside-diphosphate reductase alpha chain
LNQEQWGPSLPISIETHINKYREQGESFKDCCVRQAHNLKDSEEHYYAYKYILLDQRFLPGGRIQNSVGALRATTAFNCYVSRTIPDSMDGIMGALAESAQTMRMGGGIGYDFSTLRPGGENISTIHSPSSGPVSFMGIFDATCKTISAAGHRRGAQMGVLRIDHPDIETFIHAKQNRDALTQFNISVAVTDEFMDCLKKGKPFDLKFNDKVYDTINPQMLWDSIMRNTWEWAEPGILFIDTINKKNNLWYAEEIAATNPCGEQPLPPFGACLLGSFNLVKYVDQETRKFNYDQFVSDVQWVVRSMDNVIDVTNYPLPEQQREAKNKRRMGLGITGVANAIEFMGFPYASPEFNRELGKILRTLRNSTYFTSTELSREKGSFPLYDRDKYLQGQFIKTLPDVIQERIHKYGMRNSHLLSIAPTGTISLCADNISSGCEPVFSKEYQRTIIKDGGPVTDVITDYGYREWGVQPKTAGECTPDEHVSVLNLCSKYVDSAVSKTCNIGSDVSWEDFKDVYIKAYKGGASGCTTYRAAGSRQGVLVEKKSEEPEEGAACYIDPVTGKKSCD